MQLRLWSNLRTECCGAKGAQVTSQPGNPNYWPQIISAQPKGFKVPCMLKVVQQMEINGAAAVPTFVLNILQSAIMLGGV